MKRMIGIYKKELSSITSLANNIVSSYENSCSIDETKPKNILHTIKCPPELSNCPHEWMCFIDRTLEAKKVKNLKSLYVMKYESNNHGTYYVAQLTEDKWGIFTTQCLSNFCYEHKMPLHPWNDAEDFFFTLFSESNISKMKANWLGISGLFVLFPERNKNNSGHLFLRCIPIADNIYLFPY